MTLDPCVGVQYTSGRNPRDDTEPYGWSRTFIGVGETMDEVCSTVHDLERFLDVTCSQLKRLGYLDAVCFSVQILQRRRGWSEDLGFSHDSDWHLPSIFLSSDCYYQGVLGGRRTAKVSMVATSFQDLSE